ncbi:hypothetical protein, partial [Planktothrix sp.]|uniref:hypothetical protein n=1 Tax=Planktothrix sp. TaxID=3088171 RepID=UPI0038D494FA
SEDSTLTVEQGCSSLIRSDVPTSLKKQVANGEKKATTVIIFVDYRKLRKILAEPKTVMVVAVNSDEVLGTPQSLALSSNIAVKPFWKQ